MTCEDHLREHGILEQAYNQRLETSPHRTVTNIMLPSFQCPFGLSVQVDPVHLKAVVAEVDDEDLIVTKLRHSVEAAVGSS